MSHVPHIPPSGREWWWPLAFLAAFVLWPPVCIGLIVWCFT